MEQLTIIFAKVIFEKEILILCMLELFIIFIVTHAS